MKIKYPTRCQIVDVYGVTWRRTPEASKKHISEFGLAEKIDGLVRITLDGGNILWGNECWWIPITEADHEEHR